MVEIAAPDTPSSRRNGPQSVPLRPVLLTGSAIDPGYPLRPRSREGLPRARAVHQRRIRQLDAARLDRLDVELFEHGRIELRWRIAVELVMQVGVRMHPHRAAAVAHLGGVGPRD